MAHFQTQYSPPLVPMTTIVTSCKIQQTLFTKWDGTPTTKILLFTQGATYKLEAYYSVIKDWTKTTQSSKQLSVEISDDMLASLPCAVSSVLLNDTRFTFNWIAMLLHLLTHLNPLYSKNPPLAVWGLNRPIFDQTRQVSTKFPAYMASHINWEECRRRRLSHSFLYWPWIMTATLTSRASTYRETPYWSTATF